MLRGLLRWGQERSEKGVRVFHRVVLNLRGIGSELQLHPILSTHSEYSMSESPYEKPDHHTLPDDCSASWSDGMFPTVSRRGSG